MRPAWVQLLASQIIPWELPSVIPEYCWEWPQIQTNKNHICLGICLMQFWLPFDRRKSFWGFHSCCDSKYEVYYFLVWDSICVIFSEEKKEASFIHFLDASESCLSSNHLSHRRPGSPVIMIILIGSDFWGGLWYPDQENFPNMHGLASFLWTISNSFPW